MRYWYLELHIQCGEYEFYSKGVHRTEGKEKFDAEAYAADFYGNADEDNDPDSGTYYFNCGEVAVCVNEIKEIKKPVYDTLRKYIR